MRGVSRECSGKSTRLPPMWLGFPDSESAAVDLVC